MKFHLQSLWTIFSSPGSTGRSFIHVNLVLLQTLSLPLLYVGDDGIYMRIKRVLTCVLL